MRGNCGRGVGSHQRSAATFDQSVAVGTKIETIIEHTLRVSNVKAVADVIVKGTEIGQNAAGGLPLAGRRADLRQPGLAACQNRVSARPDSSAQAPRPAAWCLTPIFSETNMDDKFAQRIAALPQYRELIAKRSSFGWWLTLAGMLAYYGFILLVAFNKPLLAQKVGSGVTTLGMPIGVAVIVFTIIITWVYVRRANTEFDALTEQIVKEAAK